MTGTALARQPEIEYLTGRQKAAILCMALGMDGAAKLTQKLTPEEVESISLEVLRMETVDPSLTEAVLHEWIETSRAAESLAGGGEEYAFKILESAFGGQKATFIMKRLQSQLADRAGLTRLRKVDPQQLGSLLRNEHPQTIALILAHLDPGQTAGVLKEIGSVIGGQVIYRMASMEKVSPDMLQLIERSLGVEMELNLSQGMSSSGGPAVVAAVLNLVNPGLEKDLLEQLAMKDLELCEQVKNLMFVFEDIVNLDDRAIQRLLREVDMKELALALKAASAELTTRIKSSMSKRAMEALEEEIEYLGPVRVREVEAAQVGIVGRVRALEEAGEIVIATGGEDEMYV